MNTSSFCNYYVSIVDTSWHDRYCDADDEHKKRNLKHPLSVDLNTHLYIFNFNLVVFLTLTLSKC